MKWLDQITRLFAVGVLAVSVSAVGLYAQAQDDSNRRDRMQNETSMTGCLSKSSDGNYTLTDDKTGVKTMVTGTADLEKHSANHKVTLTGTAKTDASGKQVFHVDKIKHLSASCSASTK